MNVLEPDVGALLALQFFFLPVLCGILDCMVEILAFAVIFMAAKVYIARLLFGPSLQVCACLFGA
jgi:hypothetical protein